jgi:hypothetical protein
MFVEDAQPAHQHLNTLVHATVHPCVRLACLRVTFSSFQFYTAHKVLPLESVVSVLACIMMAAGNPSNGRCPSTYFYSSTSGLVVKWLYDHYLKFMNNCVH